NSKDVSSQSSRAVGITRSIKARASHAASRREQRSFAGTDGASASDGVAYNSMLARRRRAVHYIRYGTDRTSLHKTTQPWTLPFAVVRRCLHRHALAKYEGRTRPLLGGGATGKQA